MKTNLYIAAAVIMSACCNCVHAQATSDKPADQNALTNALTKVRELKTTPYHRFLREAAQIFPRTCVGKEWSDVTGILEKQKCPIVESWDNDKRRYCLLHKKAFTFENGRSLDAYLWLSADDSVPRTDQTRSLRVLEADVVLADKVNARYDELMAQHRFPRDSVLDLVLRSEKVKRAGARWPLVKSIFVNYETAIFKSGSESGFNVVVEFAASPDDDVGGERMLFFVRSGLDPVKSYLDGEKPSGAFTPKDTLGEVQSLGGNEWWSGEPAVVEANKNKYLKSQQSP